MKHLLILILSILLLSSPLFGQSQETNVLYRWKTSSGFQWKTFENGEVKPKYVGEYKDGLLNGQGTSTLFDGSKYVGEFKDGKSWNGTEYNKDGNIIGKIVNGEQIEQ